MTEKVNVVRSFVDAFPRAREILERVANPDREERYFITPKGLLTHEFGDEWWEANSAVWKGPLRHTGPHAWMIFCMSP